MSDRPGSAHPDVAHLRAYLDDRLPQDEAARVDDHVAGCHRCQRALEEAEPAVDLADHAETPAWDDRRMRRAVRRALLRTTFDVVSILLVLVLAVVVIGGFVVNPLLVQRGDRVEQARTAALDLPLLLVPGAQEAGSYMATGLVTVRHGHEFVRFVGSQPVELGDFGGRLGVFGWRPETSGALDPSFGGWSGGVPFEPERLPEGTVASVLLVFGSGIDIAEADALAADHEDVSLQWVGFGLEPVVDGERPESYGFDLGYSACPGPRGLPHDGGVSVWERVTGADAALDGLRDATADLAASPVIREYLTSASSRYPPLQRMEDVAAWLADNDPEVQSVVVTGPTSDIAEIIAAAAPDEARQLGVDLYNGPGRDCA